MTIFGLKWASRSRDVTNCFTSRKIC